MKKSGVGSNGEKIESQSGLSRARNEQINGDIIESTQNEPEFTEKRIIVLHDMDKMVIFYCQESMICCVEP